MLINNENRRRVQRAKLMLVDAGYFFSIEEWASSIADAISDLQHLAKSENVDFDFALEIATANFLMECCEDEVDELLNS